MSTGRAFTIQQTRAGFGPGGSDQVVVLGTGVDHGDGSATVTPAEGMPGPSGAVKVKLADLTDGHHPPISTRLIYDDQ